jgi:HD-like signal output (HDOD) protein
MNLYSSVGTPQVVKFALSLKVQNYLIKPYNDEVIYDEITKACSQSWRHLHFEEERSFCAQLQLRPEELRQKRQDLLAGIGEFHQILPDWTNARNLRDILARLETLGAAAEAAGVWGAVEVLNELRAEADASDWNGLATTAQALASVSRLIHCHLFPDTVPLALLSEVERDQERLARERARWLDADVDSSGPVVSPTEIERRLDSLESWPVIDTVAASFQMVANGQAASLTQAMDLAARDPGLAALVMIAANRLSRDDNLNAIEDARLAVSLLGEVKLHALAKSLVFVEERRMHLPPITWANYWHFQTGVARLTQFTCDNLEFHGLAACAHTAGLLHDIGKLLLLYLCPVGFEAMVTYSRKRGVPLAEAERRFIGRNTRELGERLGRKLSLPAKYCNVIRWVDEPERATTDADLVAIVSLARLVCLRNHVGFCGDTPGDKCPPIAETTAWQVLRNQVFPSFNLAKFEAQAQAQCATIKQELLGRMH